jgi:hypothetical protein
VAIIAKKHTGSANAVLPIASGSCAHMEVGSQKQFSQDSHEKLCEHSQASRIDPCAPAVLMGAIDTFAAKDASDKESEDDPDETDSCDDDVIDQAVSGTTPFSSSIRQDRRHSLREVRAREKDAIKLAHAQEKASYNAARASERQELKAANAQLRQIWAATRSHWQSAAGRGASALTCAGVSTDGIEVTLFEDDCKPRPGEAQVPGCMIAIDHVKGCVVVAFRGTSCFRDALLDLDCKPESLSLGGRDGLAHRGMLHAAQKLNERLAASVETALNKLASSRRVLVVGHSLGAGVAALLTALWYDEQRLPGVDIRCEAFACPQVLDADFASAMQGHTTSYISGDDCVPCFSWATARELRDALILLADPSSCGLTPDVSAAALLAAAERGEMDHLAATYATVRHVVGSEPGRLYPSGRLVKLDPGQAPREVGHTSVDEMIVTRDMVMGHMPQRYLAAVQEMSASGHATVSLWSEQSAL